MDYQQARFNMVQNQLHTWEVLDQQVLDLLLNFPREDFVPEPYRRLAYADTQIPLDEGQVMMTPRVEARLLQALGLQGGEKVLEIGTGSGYLTALLARLAAEVVSVEIRPTLSTQAAARLAAHGIRNVVLEVGDGARGWANSAPYDAIALTGSVPVLDPHVRRQLKIGGRLFVVVGEAPAMEARLITRTAEQDYYTDSLFETVIPSLDGVKAPERFVL